MPVSHFRDILHRRKRSLKYRAQRTNRSIRNFLKQLCQTEPVGRISLVEAGPACNSKTELLESTNDATFRLASGTTVTCLSLRTLVASQGCGNRAALERSLSEESFEAPEILVARFLDCIAEPRPIRLVTQNSDLVLETSSIHDLLDPDFVDSDHLASRQRQFLKVVRRHQLIDEDVLFAFNSFAPSYGHYMLTSLPLIVAFLDEIRRGQLKIVVPASFPHWMRNHLQEFGIREEHFLILRDSAYRFRSAIVSNILDARNTRAPNPNALAFVAERFEAVPTFQTPRTRLYVKRSSSGNLSSRMISNEAEVIDILEHLGFCVIEPGKMSWREQIRAFRQAEIVVSAHGSTMANLLFCQPGTKVLDLMPDDWVGVRGDAIRDVWGLRICALAKLEYSVSLCPSKIRAKHYTGNPTITCSVVISDLIASIQTLLYESPTH